MNGDPDALLASLDEQQRVVAQNLHGPMCVLAGAGTGKTRALTHRIAYGVATGAYTPGRIMALTFTTKAAAELSARLRALGAHGVSVRTFHSAALSQLGYFWPHTVGGTAPNILGGKARLLAEVAQSADRAADTATLRDLAAEIEWRKVVGLSIDEYAALATERAMPAGWSPGAVVDAQREYERLKDERRRVDFEDVLLACAGMIETEPSVALHVREQYRVFLVDEYQDVSPLQQHLLEVWLGGREELCVVGDASQTIYSFAGARSEFLVGFGRRHPNAQVVRLEHSHRSSPPIIAVANSLMRGRPGAVTLRAVRDAGEAVAPARGFDTDAAEATAVAESVARRVGAGEPAESIAILCRIWAQSPTIERALDEAGVPYRLHGASRFFDRPEVRNALMALRAASLTAPSAPLFQQVSDVLRSLGWRHEPPSDRGAVRERWDSLNAIMEWADEAGPSTSLRVFTDTLLERQAARHEPERHAVTVATLHSAKGLEWETVHLVGVAEGLLPIAYATTAEQVEEERRLFYVGITRARSRLVLSWAAHSSRGHERRASRFLQDLGTRTGDGPEPG